jgi:hypothetical protein
MKVITTKIEAARAQLGDAIKMWFHDGELASMHVLACSAFQIVSDINAARGGRDLLYDSAVVKKERRTEWIKLLKASYNFLKHADKDPDPDAQVELQAASTEIFILYACLGLEVLGYALDKTEHAFATYFALTHPDLVVDDGPFGFGLSDERKTAMLRIPKALYLEAFIAASSAGAP